MESNILRYNTYNIVTLTNQGDYIKENSWKLVSGILKEGLKANAKT